MAAFKTAYSAYVARLRAPPGIEIDESCMPPVFRPFFGQRIEVIGQDGERRRGWVGGTTGYRPVLMLLKRRNSRGSGDLLSSEDKFLRLINAGPR